MTDKKFSIIHSIGYRMLSDKLWQKLNRGKNYKSGINIKASTEEIDTVQPY